MSTRRLKWGICGLGRISNDFCSAMKTLPEGEHEIVAVASRSNERAKAFAERFGVERWYGAYKDLSTDIDVEIVYIGTNHPLHYELCIMMLNAGKHVLCEKPMTLSLKHTKEILELAEKKKLFMMEGFWSLTFPIYKQIVKELKSDNLGEVRMVVVNHGFPLGGDDQWFRKDEGGGMLMAVAVYNIMFACMVFDEMPEKIIAEAFVNNRGADEYGSMILRYSGGRMASLMYSGTTREISSCASIHGTKGSIELPAFFSFPDEATMPSGRYTNEKPKGPVKYFYENSGGLRYEADEVRRCILEGKTESPLVSHRLSEMVMKIADVALKQIGVEYDV